MNKLLQTQNFHPPWIIAHRGYRTKYPENTLIAFQAAIEAGVPMIELDVTLSCDRKLVVIHDATLERTTNGHGSVIDHTLDELIKLDAGSWFDARFADQRIPELAEVLELVNDRLFINIEIKTHAYETHHPPDAIEKQVIDLVNQKKITDSVLISSFSTNILEQLSTANNSPPLALISKKPADNDTVQMCERLKVFSWHPNHLILTRQQAQMMHDAGIRVFPYNVDTPKEYQRMLAMKVDGVITSDPFLAPDRLGHKRAA